MNNPICSHKINPMGFKLGISTTPTLFRLWFRHMVSFNGDKSKLVIGSRAQATRLRSHVLTPHYVGHISHRVKLSSCRFSTRLSAVR